MTEPNPGSARQTEKNMTRTPLIVQLAAQIVGPPTGNPLQDALRTAALNGAARAAEMNDTGFDTNAQFSHDFLAPRVGAEQGAFTLVSLGKTGTTYLVVLTERVGDAYQADVQVYNPGRPNARYYKMTLVRADNGSIRANPRR